MKTSQYVISEFIRFFESKGHILYNAASLVPLETDTSMFTIAGMKQFTRIFTGYDTIQDKRVITIQPCIRLGGKDSDIVNIGYTTRHNSIFEMLGNFSFGDYFKNEAILYAYEFLVNILKLNPEYMYITVYSDDSESLQIWNQFFDKKRIILTDDNYWKSFSTPEEFGICGPCTEILYDIEKDNNIHDSSFVLSNSSRFLEVWNIVFMQYTNDNIELSKPCIDTGMGLERICSILEEHYDNFQTDLLKPVIDVCKLYNDNPISNKIVADHVKTAVFLLAEGLTPFRSGRGYILRKLIRRAILYANTKLENIVNVVIDTMERYPLYKNKQYILDTLNSEEKTTLEYWHQAQNILKQYNNIDEKIAFHLYSTYGIPMEYIERRAKDLGININPDILLELQSNHIKQSKNRISIPFIENTANKCYETLELTTHIISLFDSNGYKVEHLTGEGYCVSSENCFYPESGGQSGDVGQIISDVGITNVIDTFYVVAPIGKMIVMKVKNADLKIDTTILLKVDQETRMGKTRAHTATHIFMDYLEKKYNCQQMGSLIKSDYFRLDVTGNSFNNKISELEEYVMSICKNNYKITVSYEDTNTVCKELNLDYNKYREYGAQLRMIMIYKNKTLSLDYEINDKINIASYQPCGGTHLSSTGEITNFIIIKESSVKSGVRRFEVLLNNLADKYMQELKKVKVNKIDKSKAIFTIEYSSNNAIIYHFDSATIQDVLQVLKHDKHNIKIATYYNIKPKIAILVEEGFIDVIENFKIFAKENLLKGGGNKLFINYELEQLLKVEEIKNICQIQE